jgi:hypothetical protein
LEIFGFDSKPSQESKSIDVIHGVIISFFQTPVSVGILNFIMNVLSEIHSDETFSSLQLLVPSSPAFLKAWT